MTALCLPDNLHASESAQQRHVIILGGFAYLHETCSSCTKYMSYFSQLLPFKFMMPESIHILLKFQVKEELFKSLKGWLHQKSQKAK